MDPAAYDRWYETPRGRWIGEREADAILEALAPRGGESLLDVGCGTGYFTRALAGAIGGVAVGLDLDRERVRFARRRDPALASYLVGDACRLPFADHAFDLAVSITTLCFVADEARAVREIVRVTRRRFAIGLLNRSSLLWRAKGRGGGRDGYVGARWHTVDQARALLTGLPIRQVSVRTAIQIPGGGLFARAVEGIWPAALPTGAFLVVAGEAG